VVCKDLSAAWVCTEHKTWVSFPCIEGATCQGGVCRMCAPDELQCLSFSTYKSCASDGRSWGGYETCDEGLSCVGGACRDCKMIQACDSLSSLETACIDDEGQKIYSESLDCQDDQICKNATCIYSGCVPSALLVIDRSSSMEYHWDTVRDSVAQWVEANPGVRFGLYTFPGEMSCTVPDDVVVPFTQGDAGPFNDFFNQWGILSSTRRSARSPWTGSSAWESSRADQASAAIDSSMSLLRGMISRARAWVASIFTGQATPAS
jgi:hypothetical protein